MVKCLRLFQVYGNTRNHIVQRQYWMGRSPTGNTQPKQINTLIFIGTFYFLHLTSWGLKLQMNKQDRSGCMFKWDQVSASASLPSQLPLCPGPCCYPGPCWHCPGCTATTQCEPQRWCQERDSSSSCLCPHGHRALLYPIIGSLLAALTQESPRGPGGNITGHSHRRSELWHHVPSTNSCGSKQLPGPGCFPLVH